MRGYTFLLVLLTVFSFSACSRKKLAADEYVKYMEDEANGLKVSKIIGDIQYSIQYKSDDYILLKENKNEQQVLEKEDLKDMQYYTMQYELKNSNKDILKVNLRDPNDYYGRTNYFSFSLQQDIYLVEGKDTLDCKLFNYMNSYGLSPKADFVMAFNKSSNKEQEDKTIVLEDKVFGGGIIKLKINKENIQQIPELIQK